MHNVLNHLEVIANLSYLIQVDAAEPELVRQWAALLEKEALALGEALRDKALVIRPGVSI